MLFIVGMYLSIMSEYHSTKIASILQFLIFTSLCIFMIKIRKHLKYTLIRTFLKRIYVTNDFKFIKTISSFLSIIFFVFLISLLLYFLNEFYHIYDKSISKSSLIENQRTIKKNTKELEKLMNIIDSLKRSKILDSLIQENSKYGCVFYTNTNGIKSLIDASYLLKSLKAFSGRIYLDIDWKRDKKVLLNEVDLKNISKGFLDGSIIVKHHEYQKKIPASNANCNYFKYKKNDYVIYDVYSKQNEQNGLHSAAFPLSSDDYKELLSQLNTELIRLIRKQ